MMKVVALTAIVRKLAGEGFETIPTGTEFEVSAADFAEMVSSGCVIPVFPEKASEKAPEKAPEGDNAPKGRGRPKKDPKGDSPVEDDLI